MSGAEPFIPYGRHTIDEADVRSVVAVLRGGALTQGPLVEEFERAVARRCGARFAVAASSGTAALHLAMLAAGLGPGDEIVGPAITFLATTNAGVYVGATPRFADVDFDTACMDAGLLEPALSERTRAVLPVHFAGRACGMAEIAALVRRRSPGAVIVEDACHALGGAHGDGAPIGSLRWADMAVLSFHPVKHITTGEGGMVLTDREDLAEKLRLFRSHGVTRERSRLTAPDEGPWYYEMLALGFNYRIPDLNCALGLSQLARLDGFVRRRRQIAALYDRELRTLPHTLPPPRAEPDRCAWHIYCLHVDFGALGKSRDQAVREFRALGVGTQVHYYPVPLQPYYRQRWGFRPGEFPNSERHYAQALSIPLFPAMTDEDVRRVIEAARTVLR